MNIVLIGFMCTGKTRVGRLLAQRLSWPFVDTDTLVSERERMPVADVIRQQGEAAFRELERVAVKTAADADKTVISTGGGVPLNPDNLHHLQRNGILIWLRATPETILRRAGNFSTRPMIDPARPLESISTLLAARAPLYAAATHAIDTDHSRPEATVQKILSLISEESM